MQSLLNFLSHPVFLRIMGWLALMGFVTVGALSFDLPMIWAVALVLMIAVVMLASWLVRRWRSRRASRELEEALDAQNAQSSRLEEARKHREDVLVLRERMRKALQTIKGSRLGQTSGKAALYELPWYMVIGNPAAGKSSAIVRSGLRFPFSDDAGNIIQGIGGTRNCDWFFTAEGILIDTAGRYSVHEEDRGEWLGFLGLLKKYRPKAPINGIVIAVSVAELSSQRPEQNIHLAKQLRHRMQELTEKLEVIAPVYVMFTKADLISGFVEFFEDRERSERDRVWGATLPYDAEGRADTLGLFERHFDELYEGLKAASVARMSLHRGEKLPPGVLTFPLEFAGLKPALSVFIATLFEDNPYQYRPSFRGFYFTSAVQEGESSSRASERVARRFGLSLQSGTTASVYSHAGFFLKELFSRVIFADRDLVRQHRSKSTQRWRQVTVIAGMATLGLCLALWTWSYANNRQWVTNLQRDLDQVTRLQAASPDLASRLEALLILQDRLIQVQALERNRPWALSFGLQQGSQLEELLRREYFHGVREVMLKPVAESIEAYLAAVRENAALLQEGSPSATTAAVAPAAASSAYTAASPTSVTDAYNALKTYLMLADRQRAEPGHLGDQITRFWRGWLEVNRGGMARERMLEVAERLIAHTVTQTQDPAFPQLTNNLALVDETRGALRGVVRGMPARERVYAEIKARASTRFAPMTVARALGEADRDLLSGSHAVSGAFTRQAWREYVQGAIRDAAHQALQTDDWVLKSTVHNDLTLDGSPEQIQKALTEAYKSEYIAQWQRFVQGVNVQPFGSFEQAVVRMNRLGDPASSPLGRLVAVVHEETAWDQPPITTERSAAMRRGFAEWFRQVVLRRAPPQVNVQTGAEGSAPPDRAQGLLVSQAFSGISRLMVARDDGGSLMRTYLEGLARLRSRFNQIHTQGEAGPASVQLLQQTLQGQSELSELLKLVDEQMLNGLGDSARDGLRPLLVRPLMQAYDILIPSAEDEINRIWEAQVHGPFEATLADRYPFKPQARVEASASDLAKIFGPEGAVARFADKTLGPLVIRRGDTLAPRTWADMGIRLNPEFTARFANWVGPLGAAAGSGSTQHAEASAEQTLFQILPQPAPGLTEYSLEIDGQALRYRNAAATWTHFVWPGPQHTLGVRLHGVSFDGTTVEFLHEPGRFGLERMVNSAQRRRIDDQTHELRWTRGNQSVAVHLRIIATPGATAKGQGNGSAGLGSAPLPRTIAGNGFARTSVTSGGAR
ncbi:type VI secretion system membrane subunit TssM [Caldimonas caldifontis]|uniref:Type VI secretion system membrane subunit TssM n=1 Tax=Caldimonas caldifontis TaxID=1452508 RepID=A0A2S5SYH9_9BURK|nr:type VI secretion system membrane subunit TssM [Caldimonas caldifontis]PPE67709.1 type VI secretion system membrane subunit TssM [Caldimonas caldifontis]